MTSDNGKEFTKLSNVLYTTVILILVMKEGQMKITIERYVDTYLREQKTTKEFVTYIEKWMNNYPRRMFNYKTPNQMFYETI